jgi:hypothetical protein
MGGSFAAKSRTVMANSATRRSEQFATRFCVCLLLALSSGCALLPVPSRQGNVHNPFPQMSKVAVAPFFNQSAEPTVDGRKLAEAYYNELQLLPGFQVTPVGVVEQAMREHDIRMNSPDDARRLAKILRVDAVVVGAVTDYTPYYPPRLGLHVEWWAANPCFHPIPPGYGLPWGTTEEELIPDRLLFEAEFALAQAQLKTQTPAEPPADALPAPQEGSPAEERGLKVVHEQSLPADGLNVASIATAPDDPDATTLPTDWPDARGFVPDPPSVAAPPCRESKLPVMTHVRTYNGHDPDFTAALANYYAFRDDARFGGWQSYLQRSDDFIRFCCHKHISEMLTARGGAGKTQVAWRWPYSR